MSPDPGALFWESMRLVAGLAGGVLVVGIASSMGLDIEGSLFARLAAGPLIILVTAVVYRLSCVESAGPEFGASPGVRGAWPASARGLVQSGQAVIVATVLLVLGSVAITWFIELLGLQISEQENILELTAPVDGRMNPAVYVLAPMALLAAPLLEEYVFRGLYFRRLLAGVGALPAFVASAVAFAAIHGNPTGVPIYLLQALIFGGVYRYTGRLSAAVAVHFLNNAITLALLLLGVGP